MKLFQCQHCAQVLFFENERCENCGRLLGFLPDMFTLSALDPRDGDFWRPLAAPERSVRFCANARLKACNWLIDADRSARLCTACSHNRTIPDLGHEQNLLRWRKIELAKHQLFYTLLRLRLPIPTRAEEPQMGLAFDFLAEMPGSGGRRGRILTGHEDGIITLNLSEADDALREQLRLEMGEPYRTLLGHFRHEIGHFYWDRLIGEDRRILQACRAVFGDETGDYSQALSRYYRDGPMPAWRHAYVSPYATAHPWEDFAETWAHYMHILDTLEMAAEYGLRLVPKLATENNVVVHPVKVDFDPFGAGSIDLLIESWLPITFAVNSINRCMGQPDLYPFSLPLPVIAKLEFIHNLVHRQVPGSARDTISVAA